MIDLDPFESSPTMIATVKTTTRFGVACEIDVHIVTGDGRRNETTEDHDGPRTDSGRGVMQSSLRSDHEINPGKNARGLAEGINRHRFHVEQSHFAIACLKDTPAVAFEPIGKCLIPVGAPILIDGNALVPRHVRLD